MTAGSQGADGTRGKLRQLADQLKAWKKGEPTPRFAHGSRGWATELELGKLESLLAARRSPLHDGVVDEQTLREECDFLAGRVQFHREVLLSMEETGHGADSHLSLERPDVGQVTREAQANGYRLPGADEGVQPDWYYYRNNASNAGQYDLVRKPTAPLDAPALRPRMVGDTHTGFVPGGRREPTPLPDDKSPSQALRDSPGFSEYAAMLEAHGIANATVLDRAVQTMHGIRELRASPDRPITIEDLRRDVKDHFRDRVIARLIDPSLDATARWARMRSMVDNLSPSERGSPKCGQPVRRGVGIGKLVGLVVVAVIIAGAIGASKKKEEQRREVGTPTVPPVDVSASKLASDYEANEVSADQLYRGKVLRVSGVVDGIKKGITDEPYVVLRAAKQFMGVHADFESVAGLSGLAAGQRITVRCIGNNVIMGSRS